MILAQITIGIMLFVCFMVTLSIMFAMGLLEDWIKKEQTPKYVRTVTTLIWFFTIWCILAYINRLVG